MPLFFSSPLVRLAKAALKPRGRTPAQPPAPRPEDQRSVERMLDGCEYELKQVMRDVASTRPVAKAPPFVTLRRPEPFVAGGRLRDAVTRSRSGSMR